MHAEHWIDTSAEEITAFFWLLLLAGICQRKREATIELWSADRPEFQRPVFLATMSRNRFNEILRYIRFDDTRTRQERKKTVKAAAVSEVFDMFVKNCKASYVPHGEVCVDEHLMSFRGRCPFRVYMKSKPDRFGVKMWMLCDVRTGYIWCVQIYTGKICQKLEREQRKQVVLDLASDLGPGCGITTDNFFTSLDLARALLAQKKTLLGTIRQRCKEVPKELWPNKTRAEYSTLFLYMEQCMLTSYVPKKGCAVVILSSQHCGNCVSGEETKFKPQVICDYNKTKGAVDTVDKMLKDYSWRRRTIRWPLAVVMDMLDMTIINSYVLQLRIGPTSEEGTSSRAETTPTNSVPKRGGSKDRKTLYRCATCNRFIFQVHAVKVETLFCTECPVTHEE
ncbi:PiggyBac transposable element-derived protein 4 [Trichinella zimbabwensis]|uniref:PiggyBac transposable element-derived protein 4 n=1 Tax=Trichinella zimbabwensis TaxID=268475 RepID=A0A0V1HLL1_9BILA|nr:PiggyBac transposable element-derived protein 4 [Trichinella zimbabwensis]